MTNAQSSPVARQISVRSIMEAVLRQGSVSRAELARLTGLSKQTTSEVIRALEQGGWIRARGRKQGAVGRSAATYELQDSGAFVLGVDLGGTKIHLALANLVGGIVAEAVEPTHPQGGLDVVRQIGAMMRRVVAEASVDPGRIRCGAMGSPGVCQPDSGRITIAPNILGLDRINVTQALRERLGFPMAVDNDVNLAAKGEQWQGCCRDMGSFAFVALGTGIGMGLMADGRLLRGARGAAGEIAYLPFGGDPFDSRGYRHGTLESALGSQAILERYRGFGGEAAQDVRGIFERLQHDDAAAEATLDEVARLLVQALMAVRAVADPEMIVLGGSIGQRFELIERVRALVLRYMADPLPVVASALGNRATIIGAIGMALTQLHDELFGFPGIPSAFALPPVRFDAAQAEGGQAVPALDAAASLT
ncbi:Sugar kinase of the NBD/HSP70 family, may contain an N-terminal HTH domain [Rhizobiales bacterium GAS191]|nr:Sugar kinase of the NBD/HSP70 family, may contain an N-terminal HTH domain [Rhizobiales bacterium GAS113]SEC35509.1 Sugar kinase of the NBD/HSP70 family, may contain an N-terminal HTH domain [Rhizobiales bacterium GAS188]SEC91700.1 Sugar kinase of the NBD/HSP70 family, may contain an N-terminal HTH domain [Rhizobiales bacterium GAS191]